HATVAIAISARKILGVFDRAGTEAERVLGVDSLQFSSQFERVNSRDFAEVARQLQTIVARQRGRAERRARLQVGKVELQSVRRRGARGPQPAEAQARFGHERRGNDARVMQQSLIELFVETRALGRGGQRALQRRQIVPLAAFGGVEYRQLTTVGDAPVRSQQSECGSKRNRAQFVSNRASAEIALAGLQERALPQMFKRAEPESPVFD